MGAADQLHRILSLRIRIQQSGSLCQGLCTCFGRQRPDRYLHRPGSADHCNGGCMAMRPYLPEYFDQPEPPRKTMTSFFQRYADVGRSDRHIQMPQRFLPTTVSHYPLDVLVGHWEKYLVDPSSAREHFPWAARFVMNVGAWAGVEPRSEVSLHLCSVVRRESGELPHE